MSEHPETHLVTKEHGPRPAGPPHLCFYCNAGIGTLHKPDCVLRTRTVVLRYSYEVVVAIPDWWDTDMMEYHRNYSTWCADNSIDAFDARKENECWCDDFKAEYVREATSDDEVKYHLSKVDKKYMEVP